MCWKRIATMNKRKSVQLIELHTFAYCLLSVSLSESFDLLKIGILDVILGLLATGLLMVVVIGVGTGLGAL